MTELAEIKDMKYSCTVDIEEPELKGGGDAALLDELMYVYGIPVGIHVTTEIFRSIAQEFKADPKTVKNYTFTLTCEKN